MYPTILIDQDLIAEAHRLAREKRRQREAAAAAAAQAAGVSRASMFFGRVQRALRGRWWIVSR